MITMFRNEVSTLAKTIEEYLMQFREYEFSNETKKELYDKIYNICNDYIGVK